MVLNILSCIPKNIPMLSYVVPSFSNKTLSNQYVNKNVDTSMCKKAQNYLGLQEVSYREYNNLAPSKKKLTQASLLGSDWQYYMKSGASWCALSMDTLLKECGYNIIDPLIDKKELNGHGKGVYATVDEFVAWGKKKGTYRAINTSSKTPTEVQIKKQMSMMHEADFIIWQGKNNLGKRMSHIGMIESVDKINGTITVLEGNANEYNRTNTRVTKVNARDGFIRKVYTINELINSGYSGYIDNSKVIKR